MNCADDVSMDPLYRRRIPTGHVSFDELYVKSFGNIPEEQNTRASQNESFESLYQKYYKDNVEDISRQHKFDDLYVKCVDELQAFVGGDDSIDFVFTLIDNSSNVSDTTPKHELISSAITKSNITSTSPFYQKVNSRDENNNTPKMDSQKIDSLIPPPVTNLPSKEVLDSLISSEIKDKSNSCSPKNSIKRVPERSPTRLNSSSSPKTPKINNTETSSALSNHRDTFDGSQTLITPTNTSEISKKKFQSSVVTEVTIDTLQHTDINDEKNNPKEKIGIKKFSLTNHCVDDSIDEDLPKKKAKLLNRPKKKTASKK